MRGTAADPISEAFRKLVEELYWQDTLEDSEKMLEEWIKGMDKDLRSLLLERRRKYCQDPSSVLSVLSLEALMQDGGTGLDDENWEKKIAVLGAMINSAFLLQCTDTWAKLDPEEKAWILAPLYRASYGLDLASRKTPADEVHLNHAIEMLETALHRAEMLGLVGEMKRYVEKMVKKLLDEERI